jgi:hypothetical protein
MAAATKVIIGQCVKNREKIVKKVQSSHYLLTSADGDFMLAMLDLLL